MPLNKAADRCTAKSKTTQKRCKNAAVTGSDKCRMHGGKTPRGVASPHFKDGRQSKYSYLPNHLSERVQALTIDELKNLEENIAIQRAMESRLMEQFTEGGSLMRWRELRGMVGGYVIMRDTAIKKELELPDAEEFLDELIVAIADGSNEAEAERGLQRELQGLHESQRKLTETLTRSRKDQAETVTEEQLRSIFTRLLHVLRNRISDRPTLAAVQKDILDIIEVVEPDGKGTAVIG